MECITVVGGGLAGLVAAISVAEQGGRVTLHEKRPTLGGRAQTKTGSYKTNLGPHALYTGDTTTWLEARGLMPPTVPPTDDSFAMVWQGERQAFPPVFEAVMKTLSLEAPIDRDYRSWVAEHLRDEEVEAAIGYLSLPTFHADPGKLSAAFCHWRLQRSFQPDAVCYIRGGWATLVGMLETRARELGVEIKTQSQISALPDGPTIIATELRTAAVLLSKAELTWPRPRTALFDLAIRQDDSDPVSVLDLDQRAYVVRASRYDDSLAPRGEQLLQCSAGLHDGEGLTGAVARIESVLDASFPTWRDRTTWSHQGVFVGAGAIDLPGTSWRDRPAIRQGDAVWLAGDCVAAPGLLSEVSFASAIIAAEEALQSLRPQSAGQVPNVA